MNNKINKSTINESETARNFYLKGNFDEAYKIWCDLANRGDADSQAWIGAMYANGDGRIASNEKSFEWYLQAAKQGHAMAAANVGAAFYMGNGVKKNIKNAIIWLKKSAEAGDLNGLFNLAVLYGKGHVEGISEEDSLKKAAELYKKASERGHYPSQSRLGYLYSVGKGVVKDRVQAYLWLTLASQHGIGTALDALESVVEKMSSEEKTAGAALFEKWRRETKSDQGPTAIYPTT